MAGYSFAAAAENIASGQSTASQVATTWFKTEGFCKNLMNKQFVHLGLGKGYSATSTYKNYWVAVLAKPS